MLLLENVEKTFNRGTINEKKALNGLNLSMKDGDFVTVIGGNGAGKSTMLNMIAGVYPIVDHNIKICRCRGNHQPLLHSSPLIASDCISAALPEGINTHFALW